MLITPAMASEPYWAAAPSRNTSIRSMAAAGIAFKSTPTVPRPNVPLTCTSAGGCRRLPLTSTSTWSGPRPRRLAGLMWSEPSAMVWWDALNDGASVARIWFTSVWPVSCTSWEVMTSTGTGVSTAVRDVRAPTTTISLRERGVAVSLKSTVTVCPAGTTTRSSAASCPMSRARTLCTPAGTLRRYCPFSLVRTLRAVPTTTTLAPASGAPDSVATTVPETVPVCCAIRGTKGTASRNTTDSRSAGVDLTGHLLENGGSQVQVWANNTASPADPLPGAFSSRFAHRSQPGFEREPLELLEWERQQQIDPPADENERDRKSTRLNSSHLVISYAVFCLKKKKNVDTVPLPGPVH